jgi:ABC-2 type transport system permease protein
MRKTFAIIRREYLERVRSKGFIISTVLIPLMMSLVMVIPMLTMDKVDPDRTVGIIDPSGDIYPALRDSLAARERTATVTLIPLDVPPGDLEGAIADMTDRIVSEELDAGVVLGPDFVETPEATFYSNSVSSSIIREMIEGPLYRVLRHYRFEDAGVPDDLHAYLTGWPDWTTLSLDAAGEAISRDDDGVFAVAFTLIMILYMMVLVYGQQTLTGVIEEKSTRVVEVILSSVPASRLMQGKILGIGGAGLTQVGIWTIAIIALSARGITIGSMNLDTTFLTPLMLSSFVIFFVLGFLLFSTLYAGVGSLCNTVQESQQFATPIAMFVIIPMLLLTLIIMDPSGTLATVLSLIPFFTPILMFMRVCLETPPLWQILLSWVLMVLTIYGLTRMAGKLFRVGILMHGAAPSWATLVKVLRQAD